MGTKEMSLISFLGIQQMILTGADFCSVILAK